MNRHKLGLGVFVLMVGCLEDSCSLGFDGCTPGELGKYGKYRFTGDGTLDDPKALTVHPTARDGYQSVAIAREDSGAADVYSLRSSNYSVLDVLRTTGGARVHALGSPGATIQLFGMDNKLIDSLYMPIVTVVPTLIYGRITSLPMVALRSTPLQLRVSLSNAVDDTLEVEAQGGASGRAGAWYEWQVTPSGSATVTDVVITARSGTASSTALMLPLVAKADELWARGENALLDGKFALEDTVEFCPYATAAGNEIIGVVPKLTRTGPIQEAIAENERDSCRSLYATGSGVARITLRLGSLTRDYDFVIGLPDLNAAPPADLSSVDAGSDL